MKRVVVTGFSCVTALGNDWNTFSSNLANDISAVKRMDEWDIYSDLNTRLAAPVTDFEKPAHYKRKQTRTMGRVAMMSVQAAERALEHAGLLDDDILKSGDVGTAFGSSTGSTDAVSDFGKMIISNDTSGINGTTYIRMMGHTTIVNIATFFGLQGRVYTTSTACTSGSQGIGYAYEAIKFGKQKIMIAGGAEELCPTESAVFDTLYATSTKNDAPNTTPSPFDKDRDGLVIGEGAGVLILEEYEHAIARGVKPLAEIVGFGSNCDGNHVTQPQAKTMQIAMELALDDAKVPNEKIDYINAHGTGTDRGDAAETLATHNLFGTKTPISSLKGNIGHTLGACGAIEAWATINMMRNSHFSHTLNLQNKAPDCAELDYIKGQFRRIDAEYVMSNNFAFGGINSSIIFKKI